MSIQQKIKFVSLGLVFTAAVALWSCGDDKSSSGSGSGGSTSTPGAEYTSTYKALLDTHCTGCHGASSSYGNFSTFANVKANKDKMISRITSTDASKVMPQSPSAAWTNTDKAKVLNYLRTSTDFN